MLRMLRHRFISGSCDAEKRRVHVVRYLFTTDTICWCYVLHVLPGLQSYRKPGNKCIAREMWLDNSNTNVRTMQPRTAIGVLFYPATYLLPCVWGLNTVGVVNSFWYQHRGSSITVYNTAVSIRVMSHFWQCHRRNIIQRNCVTKKSKKTQIYFCVAW
jgi:hypothetical protein